MVIPPSWRSASDPLSVLSIPQQVAETMEGIGSWVVSSNEELMAFFLTVTSVTQCSGHETHRISFYAVSDGDGEVRMLKRKRIPVVVW